MNIKLIIVWVVAILIFAGMGIFGFINRDLIKKDNKDDFFPATNDVVTHSCTKNLNNGISTYVFFFNKDNMIDRVNIKYAATSMSMDSYTAATSVNNMDILGVNTTLNGSAGDFTLTMNVDLTSYNKDIVNSISESLKSLSIVLNDVTNYDSYKMMINSLDPEISYTCD